MKFKSSGGLTKNQLHQKQRYGKLLVSYSALKLVRTIIRHWNKLSDT